MRGKCANYAVCAFFAKHRRVTEGPPKDRRRKNRKCTLSPGVGHGYAGAQKAYRNDSNYLVNFAAGAANDVIVDYVGNMYYARSAAVGDIEYGGGVVLSAA